MTTPAERSSASTLALAASARTIQLAVRARLLRDVAKLWPSLDPKRLDATYPGWLRAMILLLRSYHAQSSTAAAVFYRKARTEAIGTPTPVDFVDLAPEPSEEWLTEALGYAGPGMLTRDTTRPNTALSTTLGTSARVALDGGRVTVLNAVHTDPVAVGWYRVTDGHPCAFCAMLAGRGVVYRSEKTSSFQSHNDCGCTGAPAFSRTQQLPAISDTAAQIYDEHAKGQSDQLAAFRKAWTAHQAA